MPHLVLITRVPQRGAQKEPLSIGKRLAACYGFMENVPISSPSESLIPTNDCRIDSWLWENCSQVRYLHPRRAAS